jgi:DNA (cytosine-5)-methyltransferase 1
MRKKVIPVISLFCGPGGMDKGFRNQGFLPIIALDNNQAAVDTYNFNDRRKAARCVDLSKTTDAEIISMVRAASTCNQPRGVIGGPPCQSVSFSNVHRRRNDPRKRLIGRYAKIVKALNQEFGLDFFVFENVVGLRSKTHRSYFRKLRNSFRDAGFRIFEGQLNASDFGVPQSRARIFIVGLNEKFYPGIQFKFPAATSHESATVRQAIGALPPPAYFKRNIQLKDIPYHRNHWTMNPKSDKFNNGWNGNGRSFRKLSWDLPSWTVAYGNREIHIHPNGRRRITIFEAMMLQGFPKGYRLLGNLSEQVSQISDSVPPPLAGAIAKQIRRTLYDQITRIQTRLLTWFELNQRDFPWRKTTNPYKIIIAEKLLQQTAATSAVTAAYSELLRDYPTIKELADAKTKDLERVIAPLGLVYRAKELRNLAIYLMAKNSGEIPRSLQELRSLPGLGDYSARALLSFAFGMDVPIVDTNVARLLYRLFGISEPMPQNPARSKRLLTLSGRLVPSGRAREFNLACLDLCSLVCKAREPKCSKCPLVDVCHYGRNVKGTVAMNSAKNISNK